jgi:hypothetical protein
VKKLCPISVMMVNNFTPNPRRGGIPAKEKKFRKNIKDERKCILVKLISLIDERAIRCNG